MPVHDTPEPIPPVNGGTPGGGTPSGEGSLSTQSKVILGIFIAMVIAAIVYNATH